MEENTPLRHTFSKSERINSKILIDQLFSGGNMAMSVFPLRAICMIQDADPSQSLPPVQVLVSVPKKKLRLAVDRNRMKRQIREAYRLNKDVLWSAAQMHGKQIYLAFICISDEPCTSQRIARSVQKLLRKVVERLSGE